VIRLRPQCWKHCADRATFLKFFFKRQRNGAAHFTDAIDQEHFSTVVDNADRLVADLSQAHPGIFDTNNRTFINVNASQIARVDVFNKITIRRQRKIKLTIECADAEQ